MLDGAPRAVAFADGVREATRRIRIADHVHLPDAPRPQLGRERVVDRLRPDPEYRRDLRDPLLAPAVVMPDHDGTVLDAVDEGVGPHNHALLVEHAQRDEDRKSTRLNSSHSQISY